jgi:CubicO group peptidase (beta-lactamase class C family)
MFRTRTLFHSACLIFIITCELIARAMPESIIKKINPLFLSLCLILTIAGELSAQSLPDSILNKIDTLFSKWDNAQSPGCVVGIVRNDSLIFAKGYGMANLEYGVPNTPQTVYQMASVSKQFTAYAIILLAQQGKLQLDDDIRKWLPWFPDMKQKITIRNLLNHTSGIRDQWQLLAIAGTRMDDVITQEQIVKMLSKQQALNFNPGEQFSYSNSGFTLLAEIVKTVSGQSLRKFADSAIFNRLEMSNTHFYDDYTEIEKNRAYSYDSKDGVHFSNSISSYSTTGATGLHASVTDLSKWIMNFYDVKAGNQQDILTLTQNGKLNNGRHLDYAAGINNVTYKGWKQYQHGGNDAGFRTNVSIFPELKMGFIVLANVSEINAGDKANEMADLFMKNKTIIAANKEPAKQDSARLTAEEVSTLKSRLGDYISAEGNTLSLEVKNDSLYYRVGTNAYLLVKASAHVFYMFYDPDILFDFNSPQDRKTLSVTTTNEEFQFKKYQKKTLTDDKSLQEYTGDYYSPELDCNYGIILKDHQLYLTNNKYNDAKLTLAGSDHLLSDNWWMNHLLIIRNNSHQIAGFEVNSSRVMHLKFIKVKPLRNIK